MTHEQLEKINKLNRLYYAEMKLKSSYSVKCADKKRARDFKDMCPEKGENTEFKECKKEIYDFYKSSANNYITALKEYKKIREETEKIIDSAENSELCAILKYHYIEYKTWEKISEKMFYSLRTIKYKHKSALDKIKI